MRPRTLAALAGVTLVLAAILAVSAFLPRQANAAPAPVSEQYRIVSLRPYGDDVKRMEEDLNKLAADGWRVRTGIGAALVLAK